MKFDLKGFVKGFYFYTDLEKKVNANIIEMQICI